MIKIGHIESFAYSTAKAAVIGRARDYASQYGISMEEAVGRVLGEDLPLMMRFSAEMSGESMNSMISRLSHPKGSATDMGSPGVPRGGDEGDTPLFELPKIGQDLDSRVKEYMFQHPELSYGEAYSFVMEHEPGLRADYQNEIIAPIGLNSAAESRGMSPYQAGVEVAERVIMYFSEHEGAPYQTAMKFVLDADPALKRAYDQTES